MTDMTVVKETCLYALTIVQEIYQLAAPNPALRWRDI